MDVPENPIELIVPSSREMMRIVRLTSAGILSRYCLDMDALDDAKMAVEEACLALIQYAGRERIRLIFTSFEDRVEILATAEGGAAEASRPQNESELEVVKAILESMADEAQLGIDEGGISSIRMVKKFSG